ncbi:MAG: hypothetical protein GY800_09160 [Planctomycetes bacterium]|nr:hypothetical protein [Planctomycetota bacterium]
MAFFPWAAKRREQEFKKNEHEEALAGGNSHLSDEHHRACIASAERLIKFIDDVPAEARYA